MKSTRFIRERERREITGVPTSTWYEMMDAGLAPRPAKIGTRAVAWVEFEIQDWLERKVAERDGAAA